MAKTKTTTHKFYVVDLVRRKPKTQYIEIPPCRVDVQIEVVTKGLLSASDVPSAALKRLEDAAREALQKYEDTITSEAERLDAKVVALMKEPTKESQAEAEKLAQGVNQSIKNALDSAEGAADKAVEERLKKEIQQDKNLKEARVRTVIKVVGGGLSIAASVSTLVASHGASVTSYLSIAKTVYALGAELKQQLKNEEKLRKDLIEGIQAYITLRGTTLQQAVARQGVDMSGVDITRPLESIKTIALKVKNGGAELLKGRDAKGVASEVMDYVVKGVKSKLSEAEQARVHYRNQIAKTREKTDALSLAADKLSKAMKAATTLKDGVKIGAEVMALKRGVTEMAKKLVDREKFLEEMQELMKGNGLSIDDRTTIDKLKELDKMTALETASEIYSHASTIYGLIAG